MEDYTEKEEPFNSEDKEKFQIVVDKYNKKTLTHIGTVIILMGLGFLGGLIPEFNIHFCVIGIILIVVGGLFKLLWYGGKWFVQPDLKNKIALIIEGEVVKKKEKQGNSYINYFIHLRDRKIKTDVTTYTNVLEGDKIRIRMAKHCKEIFKVEKI
jgi:hypothetical protein